MYGELIRHFKDFESNNDVYIYEVDGVNIWPLLKMAITVEIDPFSGWANRRSTGSAAGAFRGIIRKPFWLARTLLDPKLRSFDGGHESTVLFLTVSDRRVLYSAAYYEIYTDPIREVLNALGVSSNVWELGRRLEPQFSQSDNITLRLSMQANKVFSRSDGVSEPAWYKELQIFISTLIGATVSWKDMVEFVRLHVTRSRVFERWLSKVKPELLLVVCWYSPQMMAAVSAAKRLGIRTVDLQHGLQGLEHPAYAGWEKLPPKALQVVPDVFWVWGDKAAEDLRKYNPGFAEAAAVLVGGNPWLSKYMESLGSHVKDPRNSNRRILVTLQQDVPTSLLRAIADSPRTWQWIVRFHPARKTSDRREDVKLFAATKNSMVSIDEPGARLLFDQLSDCDVHVTEASTCALEALAFGLHTIILGDTTYGEIGASAYRSYIMEGAMTVACGPEKIISAVSQTKRWFPVSSTASSRYFANARASEAAIRTLLCI